MTRPSPVSLLVLYLATTLATSSPGQVPVRGPLIQPAGLRVVELLRASRGEAAPSGEETVSLLREVVADGLEDVGRLLVAQRLPAFAEGEEPQTLSQPQSALLAQALESVPADLLRAQADAVETAHPHARGRAAALFLWTPCARPSDVPRLAGLAAPRPAPTDQQGELLERPREVLDAFEAATCALLARDLGALSAIGDLVRSCDDTLLPAVVRALGRGGRPEALRLLLDLARNHPELDALAISQVRRLGAAREVGINQAWGAYLRERLGADDGAAGRVAVLAVGTVHDFDSIPHLLDLVDGGGGIARDAFEALREMTGLRLPEDPLRWRRWFDEEQAWFAHDFPDLRVGIRSDDLATAVASVREIAQHRYRRDELAEELVEVLYGQHVQLRAVTCQALGTLGSPRAIEALIELVELAKPPAGDAAHAALVVITGRTDVPLDADSWRAELGL